jgi:tripartite-type tricarboxylate transporter receptor subunit TctC
MNFTRRFALGLGLAATLATPAAFAQAFPNKPLKLIVNFPPGGAADLKRPAPAPQLGD